jgi:hypothetical protein
VNVTPRDGVDFNGERPIFRSDRNQTQKDAKIDEPFLHCLRWPALCFHSDYEAGREELKSSVHDLLFISLSVSSHQSALRHVRGPRDEWK